MNVIRLAGPVTLRRHAGEMDELEEAGWRVLRALETTPNSTSIAHELGVSEDLVTDLATDFVRRGYVAIDKPLTGDARLLSFDPHPVSLDTS